MLIFFQDVEEKNEYNPILLKNYFDYKNLEKKCY